MCVSPYLTRLRCDGRRCCSSRRLRHEPRGTNSVLFLHQEPFRHLHLGSAGGDGDVTRRDPPSAASGGEGFRRHRRELRLPLLLSPHRSLRGLASLVRFLFRSISLFLDSIPSVIKNIVSCCLLLALRFGSFMLSELYSTPYRPIEGHITCTIRYRAVRVPVLGRIGMYHPYRVEHCGTANTATITYDHNDCLIDSHDKFSGLQP
ncbi:hypothetical protein BHM03_00009079 [Ensete ventricosum]|nr:hypothetical protein BHM03_00009079 [Ensete ventricosum]